MHYMYQRLQKILRVEYLILVLQLDNYEQILEEYITKCVFTKFIRNVVTLPEIDISLWDNDIFPVSR